MLKSKTGKWFLGIYLLMTCGINLYAVTCSDMYCGLVIVLPVMPWPFMLEGLFQDSSVLYAMLVMLNSIILYVIGQGVSKLFNRGLGV